MTQYRQGTKATLAIVSTLAALGAAACADSATAPTSSLAPRGALLDVATGRTATAQVCKVGPVGTYTFHITESGNTDNLGDVFTGGTRDIVVTQGGVETCITVLTRVQADEAGLDQLVSITAVEAPAPGTNLVSIVGTEEAGPASSDLNARSGTVVLNAFHNAKLTFTNEAVPTVQGCTYTQGFWKNKGAKSGLLASVLAGSGAYVSGGQLVIGGSSAWGDKLTAAEIATIFGKPPAGGDAEIILLHQLIAAELNISNGASAPAGILADISTAQSLLVGGISAGEAAQAKAIAGRLDAYNNGEAPGGPGHCD